MKFLMTVLMSLTIIGSAEGQASQHTRSSASGKRYTIDRDKLTRDVMNYCKQSNDPAIADFFMAYKAEYPDAAAQWDPAAFKDVRLMVDSFDENFKIHPMKQIQAGISMTVSNSEPVYKTDDKAGRLYFVGLRFDLTDKGEIIRHREHLVFFNSKKTKDKSKIVFLGDGKQKRSYNYRKKQ